MTMSKVRISVPAFACCGRKLRARDAILLVLAVTLIASQLLVFHRFTRSQADHSGTDLSGKTSMHRNIHRAHFSSFAVSKISSTRNKTRNNGSSKIDPEIISREMRRVPNATDIALLRKANPYSDGFFNGYPIYKQNGSNTATPIHSQLHCIGETWHPPTFWKRKREFLDVSWQHRSCHFEFFCYDAQEKEFAIYLNQKDLKETTETTLLHLDNYTSFWDVSQTYYRNMTQVMPNQKLMGKNQLHVADVHHPYGVSIGSINGKWAHTGIPRLNWFPKIRYGPIPIHDNSYDVYTLPSSVVMIPFHSLSASNPGHLVWDDWLPIYSLLQIFGFSNDGSKIDTTTLDLLLLRYILPPDRLTNDTRGLWAGCDWLAERAAQCQNMLHKFAPLMIRNEAAWQTTTQKDPDMILFDGSKLQEKESNGGKNKLVCARNGLAGIGQLSDHGTDKGHGWEELDYTIAYNLGRGGQFWQFRNFMMKNIGIASPEALIDPREPLKVFFSANSSEKMHRSMSFAFEMKRLLDALESRSHELDLPPVEVERYQFSEFSVKEQVKMVSKAAVFITTCGGGAVTATFLPRGASLLVYFPGKGGVENNKWSGKPARLDWDYFNNLGYLRVSWLPQPSKHDAAEVSKSRNILVDVILHELQVVYQQRQLQAQS
jgi:hypothetical protein